MFFNVLKCLYLWSNKDKNIHCDTIVNEIIEVYIFYFIVQYLFVWTNQKIVT
jgi:hypothetical protein